MNRCALGLTAAVMLVGLAAPAAAGQETADLALTKSATYPTIRMGGLVTYTVTVTNLGPGVAFGDPMPDQLNLVDSTCGTVSAFCTIASLASGSSATMTILAVPIVNLAPEERSISNTAFIESAAKSATR